MLFQPRLHVGFEEAFGAVTEIDAGHTHSEHLSRIDLEPLRHLLQRQDVTVRSCSGSVAAHADLLRGHPASHDLAVLATSAECDACPETIASPRAFSLRDGCARLPILASLPRVSRSVVQGLAYFWDQAEQVLHLPHANLDASKADELRSLDHGTLQPGREVDYQVLVFVHPVIAAICQAGVLWGVVVVMEPQWEVAIGNNAYVRPLAHVNLL
jgi:hypothetical protein